MINTALRRIKKLPTSKPREILLKRLKISLENDIICI